MFSTRPQDVLHIKTSFDWDCVLGEFNIEFNKLKKVLFCEAREKINELFSNKLNVLCYCYWEEV